MCYRCHKPQLTCICGSLRRVANRTRVWVLQHLRERFHPLGTARIAQLGLDDVHVEVVRPGGASPEPPFPPRTGLLFPGPGARDLAGLLPQERPETLVVIDGTWAHARTLYRDNSWLQRLPHYQLTPRRESRYRLRKEPAPECVSTIEAIVDALHILEPDTPGLDGLLASFDAMIDQQLDLIRLHGRGPRRRNAPRTVQGAPRWIVDEPERLVVVGFEAASRHGGEDRSLAIVHCVALRLATGEVFQHFVQPPPGRFPSPCYLQHMGLTAELLQAGSTEAGLKEAWRRFIDPGDVVVAWNNTVLDALDSTVGLPALRFHLKSAYRSHAKAMRGSLASMIDQLRLHRPVFPQLVGRAGAHVVDVAALLTHLQAKASPGAGVDRD